MNAEQSSDGTGQREGGWRGFLDVLALWARMLLNPGAAGSALLIVILFGLFAVNRYPHWGAGHLRRLGADVGYGPKGGYFITLPPGADVTEFLGRGARDLRHLSRSFYVSLTLDGTDVSDSDLRLLQPMEGAVGLNLSLCDTAITDEGLAYLQGLPHIGAVDVTGSPVTGEAVGEFRRSRGLNVDEPSGEPAPASGSSPTLDP